ncbi:hypothetical protein [Nocardia africana]|uniref:hypothetical protein n=1 Tax=Nocardia africana TaxID=134964 RepID=UPI00215D83EC|nr:hypothetical protein [Nocardia africana]
MVALEPLPQEIGEQRVVTEPFAVVVEAAQEQVAPLDVLEQRPPLRPSGQLRREGPADLVGDSGFQQRGQQSGLECVEHVVGQIFADRLVPSGHGGDRGTGVVAAAQ